MVRRVVSVLLVVLAACSGRASQETGAAASGSANGSPAVSPNGSNSAAGTTNGSTPSPTGYTSPASTYPLHAVTDEQLLRFFPLPPESAKNYNDANLFLKKNVGVGTASRINQGNHEMAKHAFSREQCLEGLKGIELQTDEQRRVCGAENMVPVWKKGGIEKSQFCIDIFEYPNEPCELPVVWVAPVQAKAICEMQGKRLCVQEEWMMACGGDPAGGKRWNYAYGDELDLTICNTNKAAKSFGEPICEPGSAKTAWGTCRSNSDPSGSYPKCRSRFGVFDQHGNVAEIMTRLDADGKWYDQLKGSAFFYVDVARKHTERQVKGGRETYPDHCNHDPRWHVEPMETAWHVNYHLGFRCCKTLR